jgi:NADH-quinone oxidoreductase subunit J
MTQPSSRSELLEKTRHRLRRYWYLPAIIVLAGAVLAYFAIGASASLPPALAAGAETDVRQVLWGTRQTDLIGQVIVIFAGVFGVIVLFKERKN